MHMPTKFFYKNVLAHHILGKKWVEGQFFLSINFLKKHAHSALFFAKKSAHLPHFFAYYHKPGWCTKLRHKLGQCNKANKNVTGLICIASRFHANKLN